MSLCLPRNERRQIVSGFATTRHRTHPAPMSLAIFPLSLGCSVTVMLDVSDNPEGSLFAYMYMWYAPHSGAKLTDLGKFSDLCTFVGDPLPPHLIVSRVCLLLSILQCVIQEAGSTLLEE